MVNAGVFPKLIELLSSAEFDIQKESAWAISNATSGGTPAQILYLAENGAIPPLCNLLRVLEVKVVTVSLEGLENILRAALSAGDAIYNRIVASFNECGGLAQIEDLQVRHTIT